MARPTICSENVSSARRTPRICVPSFGRTMIVCGASWARRRDGAGAGDRLIRIEDLLAQRIRAVPRRRREVRADDAAAAVDFVAGRALRLPANSAAPGRRVAGEEAPAGASPAVPARLRMYETSCQDC